MISSRSSGSLLLAMATGTGKTRTCICLLYRLLKAGRFRRALFLVDRTSLGDQAHDAFTTLKLEQQQSFTEIYEVKGLGDVRPEGDTRLHVATIQGMVRRLLDEHADPIPVESSPRISDDDACPSTCQPASCGDGFVHAGVEECDDGNNDNSDDCLSACIAASCGDGVLHAGAEECDDGNDIPNDGCNAECVRDRLVFLTEEPLTPAGFKSLFGADNLCRKTTMDYGHPNFENFRAWLSDDASSPATTFHKSSGRYILVTGEVVAENWKDLIDGSLVNGIDRTLSGEKLYEHAAWTSTLPDGSAWDVSLDCENWSTSAFEENARQGVTGYTDSRWTDDTFLTDCDSGGLLYCFGQE